MVVHLGAGLAQSLGQFINLFEGSLPVMAIPFAGDTGSYYDRIGMDLDHREGPTSISTPSPKPVGPSSNLKACPMQSTGPFGWPLLPL